jgi:hypothetical protein
MKLKSILCLITIVSFQSSFAQDELRDKLKEAWELYQAKSYAEAGEKYEEALMLSPNDYSENGLGRRFNTACAWSLAGNSDKAFDQLFTMAQKGKYTNLENLNEDADLNFLKKDTRWNELISIVSENYEAIKPLTKDELITIFEKYQTAYNNVFAKGSTVESVDELYSFYTEDFEYNHPGYGGIYARELLYNNTLRALKRGSYETIPKRITLTKIYGKNAVVIEQQYEGSEETTMTLFEFRKSKICYIEEYW